MRIITSLFLLAFATLAQAGVWLQFLHNNSNANVVIRGNLPSYWVDTPAYPIHIEPGVSVIDVDYFNSEDARGKTCRKPVKNIALPDSCDKKHYVSVTTNKASYRLWTCNWEIIQQETRTHQTSRQPIPFGLDKVMFGLHVDGKGTSYLHDKQKNVLKFDQSRKSIFID